MAADGEGGVAAEHGTELPPELAAAVGEHLRAFVAAQVKSGRYSDAAEVLRAALHLFEEQEWPEGLPSDAEIRAMVEEGDASGVVDEEPALLLDQLRAKLAAMPPGEEEREGP